MFKQPEPADSSQTDDNYFLIRIDDAHSNFQHKFVKVWNALQTNMPEEWGAYVYAQENLNAGDRCVYYPVYEPDGVVLHEEWVEILGAWGSLE
jgi:hypothetical protein